MRRSPAVVLDQLRRRFPLTCYLSAMGFVTLAATLLFLRWSQQHDAPWLALLLLAVPALVCASHLGLGLANWLATQLLSPQSLPRMDFEQGIPPEHRTLVAVPTMLTSAAGIERLLDGLEVRYLSNRDPCLHFALLTDFVDAASETLPGDAELVRLAREGVERLNAKYADVRTDIFYLFHRPRRWNAQEGCLDGLRAQTRQAGRSERHAPRREEIGTQDRFSEVVGQTAILPSVRYVITLDTDTQLPRDAARQMVGTLAHPLNRPVFDAQCSRVVDGYTILQPRVGVSLPSAHRSRFAQLYAEIRASIRTRASYRTCTRICLPKARSSARGSTTSIPSNSAAATFPRTRSSATT
jgi:cyclic beta-1,2-glucan synthetase